MRKWLRKCCMKTTCNASYPETWTSNNLKGQERNYKVNVFYGKPVDIFSFKSKVIKNFGIQASHIRSSRILLKKRKTVKKCPVCDVSSKDSEFCLNVYGFQYCQCSVCDHCFVINRLTEAELKKFYSKDIHYASTYAESDKQINEIRIRQVVMPKLEWMIKQFELLYKRKPPYILDIGAGGGHFVYACKSLGIDADGIELSEISRKFCKKNFGFDLRMIDFTKDWKIFKDVSIVTFWGVIEHVPNPIDFLNAAHKVLSKEGLVVAEVPRWDSMSTAIQRVFPDSIIRHLDPLGHINCFTDSSLNTAFEISKFAPVAAWYFGMDTFELVTQLSYFLKNDRIVNLIGEKLVSSFQPYIDKGYLSDEVVLLGRPITNEK